MWLGWGFDNNETNTDTNTNTDGMRVNMGEVSHQKGFPYNGRMCRCSSFFDPISLFMRKARCRENEKLKKKLFKK